LRGRMGEEVTPELAFRLGRALPFVSGLATFVVGGDFRQSTPELKAALIEGLVQSGALVYDVGQLSTPAYYFARRWLKVTGGVMVTASHSPPDHNGFKPVLGALPLTPGELKSLKTACLQSLPPGRPGEVRTFDVKPFYLEWLERLFANTGVREIPLVLDCGHGAVGWILPEVKARLGLEAELLFAEPDGAFPVRSPDIAGPDDLALLQQAVLQHKAALGAGFDGDGDRVGFVTHEGKHISSDVLVAWLAKELLAKTPSRCVVCDVKLSRAVEEVVLQAGGLPLPSRSGHTFMKKAMLEHRALFGGEASGHLFYEALQGGDDGLYSALLVAQLVQKAKRPLAELLAEIPAYCLTHDIRVRYEGDRRALLEQVRKEAAGLGGRVSMVDGVKVTFESGWALVRASVTEPAFTFRFEGKTGQALLEAAEALLACLPEVREQVLAQVEATASKCTKEAINE